MSKSLFRAAVTALLALSVFLSAQMSHSATLPLPRTGQTTCVDNSQSIPQSAPCVGTGQDGEIQAGLPLPATRFSTPTPFNGNGNIYPYPYMEPVYQETVTDNLTGLEWARYTNSPTAYFPDVGVVCAGGDYPWGNIFTWQQALAHIDCLNSHNFGGKSDWRLPNIKELEVVTMSYGAPTDWLNSSFHSIFNSGNSSPMWSSTTAPHDANIAYIIDGAYALTGMSGKNGGAFVWPVRGTSNVLPKTGQTISYMAGDDGAIQAGVEWPKPRFTDNNNQTITDNLTGLIWTKDSGAPGPQSCETKIGSYDGLRGYAEWKETYDYINCLNVNSYLGFSDWRLPNIFELTSLINRGGTPDSAAWLATQGFTNMVTTSAPSPAYTAYRSSTASSGMGRVIAGVATGSIALGYIVADSGASQRVWPVRGGDVNVKQRLTVGVTGPCNILVDTGTLSTLNSGIASGLYSTGSVVALTAQPSPGYDFTGWTGACSGTGSCPVTLDVSKVVFASCSLIPTYNVVFNSDGNGTVSGTTPQIINEGSSTTKVTAIPTSGYQFVNWTEGTNVIATTPSLTVANITADRTFTANFVLNYNTVTPYASAGGTISPSTPQLAARNSTAGFTVIPGNGNHLVQVYGCGGTLNGSTYTTGLITADCQVTAIFADAGGNLLPPYYLPRTGQVECWETYGTAIACKGTGQDGEFQAGVAWPAQRFTQSDGVTAIPTTDTTTTIVRDNLTGLEWSRDAGAPTVGSCIGGMKSWLEALDYVACLNSLPGGYLGHNDWRLPNINELDSLVYSLNIFSPSLPTGLPFTNVKSADGYYWSSTTAAYRTGDALVVYMYDGAKFSDHKVTVDSYPWPVRSGEKTPVISLPATGQTVSYYAGDDGALKKGAPWPATRHTNPDGSAPVSASSVLDTLTGLEWLRDAGTPTIGACTGGAMAWQNALDYVRCLNTSVYLGHTDWRLPNRNELMSFINYDWSDSAVWLNAQGFLNVKSEAGNAYYWSATTYTQPYANGYFPDAWLTGSFYYVGVAGYLGKPSGKSKANFVWPVRGGVVSTSLPIPQFALTVTKSGNGIGIVTANAGSITWTGNNGSFTYNGGDVITLTASASPGSIFRGWTGCDTTNANQCTVAMNSSKNVTATFSQIISGDLNYDGNVTAVDALLALRVAVGLDAEIAEKLASGDIDNSGHITAVDALYILRKAVGLDIPVF